MGNIWHSLALSPQLPPHPLQGQKVSLLAAFDSVLKSAKQSYKDDALIKQNEINFPHIKIRDRVQSTTGGKVFL